LIWSIARQVAQDLSYGILPKNLTCPTDNKDVTTIIACYRHSVVLPRGLLSRTGDQLGRRTGSRRCPTAGHSDARVLRARAALTGCAPSPWASRRVTSSLNSHSLNSRAIDSVTTGYARARSFLACRRSDGPAARAWSPRHHMQLKSTALADVPEMSRSTIERHWLFETLMVTVCAQLIRLRRTRNQSPLRSSADIFNSS
jgi:hypothetical protein